MQIRLRALTRNWRQLRGSRYELNESKPPPPPSQSSPLKPHGTDWLWRPDLWVSSFPLETAAMPTGTRVSGGVSLFHDDPKGVVQLQQHRASRGMSVGLHVGHFEGNFVSLTVDLPAAAVHQLSSAHIFGLRATGTTATEVEAFARLNLEHGPNSDAFPKDFELGSPETCVEFELAQMDLSHDPWRKAWIDVIFADVSDTSIQIDDLVLYRRLRAPIT